MAAGKPHNFKRQLITECMCAFRAQFKFSGTSTKPLIAAEDMLCERIELDRAMNYSWAEIRYRIGNDMRELYGVTI